MTAQDKTNGLTATVAIHVVQRPQTITFRALPAHTYGDAPFNLSATASSNLPVSFRIVSGPATVSGNTLTITGAGQVTVEAFESDSSLFAATAVDETFTVSPALLIISAVPDRKTYDGTTASSASPSVSTLYNGDKVIATEGFTAKDVEGAGGSTLTVEGFEFTVGNASNYTVTTLTASGTITPLALTVTPPG